MDNSTSFMIQPHSIVDLITNSSTTIYTNNPDKRLVQQIFDAVLTAGGSDKKAEDLFTFTVVPDMDVIADKLDSDFFNNQEFYLETEEQIKYANLIKDKLPPVLKDSLPEDDNKSEQVEKFKSVWSGFSDYQVSGEICLLLADEIIKDGLGDRFQEDEGPNEYLHIELKPEYIGTLTQDQLDALNSLHDIFDTTEGYN